jgi:hypothetical protein
MKTGLSSHKIVNFKHYVRMILSPFFDQLTDEEKFYGNFVHISVNALDEAFSKLVVN